MKQEISVTWYHVQFGDNPRRTLTANSPRGAQESYAHIYAISFHDIPSISVCLHPTWNDSTKALQS
jgi:hypothetical protein